MKEITLMGGNATTAASDGDEEDEKHALSSDDIYHAECMRQKYLLLIIETHTDSVSKYSCIMHSLFLSTFGVC